MSFLRISLICIASLSSMSLYGYTVHPMALDYSVADRKPKKMYITNTSNSKPLYMSIQLFRVLNKGFPTKSRSVIINNQLDALIELVETAASAGNTHALLEKQIKEVMDDLLTMRAAIKSHQNLLNITPKITLLSEKVLSATRNLLKAKPQNNNITKSVTLIAEKAKSLHVTLLQPPLKQETLYKEEPLSLQQMKNSLLVTPTKVKINPKQRKAIMVFNRWKKPIDNDVHYKIYLKEVKGEMINKKAASKDGALSLDVGVTVNYSLPIVLRTQNIKGTLDYNYDVQKKILTLINNSNTIINVTDAKYCDDVCVSSLPRLQGKFYHNNRRVILVDEQHIEKNIVINYQVNNKKHSMKIKL